MAVNDDNSGFITSEYEGVSTDFTEINALPSDGSCDLYKAKRYGRWFLLKCLKAEQASQPLYQQMLRKEFEIGIGLTHAHVMQTMGFEKVNLPERGEAMCLVVEWIDGRTLDKYLTESPTISERRRIAIELAEAVAYIHAQQVVHRDLKPSNIMVTHNGDYVKVIDFGLADTNSHAVLKQPAGTMKYMAPEQAQLAVADVRNDIYSLGIIFEEMNLGKGKWRKVVRRCLRPATLRYQQMDELLTDIHSRRRQHLAWAAAALGVMAVIAALVLQISKLRKDAAQQALQLKILNHEIIGFADEEVKRLCVKHWDKDGDGEMSFEEAAAVDSLGQVFKGNRKIRTFDELQHFTGLKFICAEAFRDCIQLWTVKLPTGVRYIRHDTFRHTALEWFTFPGTLLGLGDHILEDCEKLETVVFEAKLPGTNMTDENRLFVNCPRLSTIFVPTIVMRNMAIGKRASDEGKDIAWGLKYDDEHTGETNYGYIMTKWAQYGYLYDKMTDIVVFRDPVVKDICVKKWDRDGDHELSIDEVTAVKELGMAFCANDEITSFDELLFFVGIKEIPASCFEDCYHLKSVRLPNSLHTINEFAFNYCRPLTDIQLPERLETISQEAFYDCNLQSIYIPAHTVSISSTAFSYNRHLSKVEVSPDNTVYDSRDHCNAIIETATNKMITGSATAFFPKSVDSMSDEALVGFVRPSLTIPSQVKAIGQWALLSFIDTVYCESPIPPSFNSDNGQIDMFKSQPVICVPKGAREAYAKADGWKYHAKNIQEWEP